jgi:hypothetical protein
MAWEQPSFRKKMAMDIILSRMLPFIRVRSEMSDRKDYKAPAAAARAGQTKKQRISHLRKVRNGAAKFFNDAASTGKVDEQMESSWRIWMFDAAREYELITRGTKMYQTAKKWVSYLTRMVLPDIRGFVHEVSVALDRIPAIGSASAAEEYFGYQGVPEKNENAEIERGENEDEGPDEWAREDEVADEELARALQASHSPPRVKIPAAAAAASSSPRGKAASSSPRAKGAAAAASGSPKGKGSAAAAAAASPRRTVWEQVCGNAEDPISLNSWSELGPDADVVSIFSAEGGGDKGKCYERKSLIDSFAHNQNLAWPGPTKVFKMPEGEWIVEAARAVLADQKWSVYQLAESRGFHGVGARREDSQKEAVYQIVPVQSLAELRASLRPRRQSPVRPPPEAPIRPRKRRQGEIDLTADRERDPEELLAEIEELQARLHKCHLDLALCRSANANF